MKQETQDWVALAETDLQAAQVLLEAGLFSPVVFHCQQGVEKLLKAIWIEAATEGSPPRIHDLVALAKLLAIPMTSEQLDFLARLSEQYIPTRYADRLAEYAHDTVEGYLEETQGFFAWLRPQLS